MYILREYVVIEIERSKIKEIDIHWKIGVARPRDLVKSAMLEPELRNGQMMD